MEIYNGMVCFDNMRPVRYGNLSKKTSEINLKFEKRAWPPEKRLTGLRNDLSSERVDLYKPSKFINMSQFNDSKIDDRFVYHVI